MLDFSEVANKAFQLLKKYPLCDRCLGRCFARLSFGHTNEERGKAIKLYLLMQMDYLIKEHKIQDLGEIREVLLNMGGLASTLYSTYFNEQFQKRDCYICGCKLEELEKDFLSKAEKILEEKKYKTFILGVTSPQYLKDLEEQFVIENGLTYYESIKNELKREVGKKLVEKGYKPDFETPEVELVYDWEYQTVIENKKTYKYLVFYNRLLRGIPISEWYAREGKSLEKSLGLGLHAPYTEPSEVRILEEYPLIVEGEGVRDVEGYKFKVYGKVLGKELDTIYTIKPVTRTYRVTIFDQEGCVKFKEFECVEVFKGVLDLFITVKDFKELKEKIDGLEILGIDLISTSGKSSLLYTTYVRE